MRAFPDRHFDRIICSRTVQELERPGGRNPRGAAGRQAPSRSGFVNHGFWKNRLDALLRGRKVRNAVYTTAWHESRPANPLIDSRLRGFLQREVDPGRPPRPPAGRLGTPCRACRISSPATRSTTWPGPDGGARRAAWSRHTQSLPSSVWNQCGSRCPNSRSNAPRPPPTSIMRMPPGFRRLADCADQPADQVQAVPSPVERQAGLARNSAGRASTWAEARRAGC